MATNIDVCKIKKGGENRMDVRAISYANQKVNLELGFWEAAILVDLLERGASEKDALDEVERDFLASIVEVLKSPDVK